MVREMQYAPTKSTPPGPRTIAQPGHTGTKHTGGLALPELAGLAYGSLRENLDPERGLNLALPPDQELLSVLTAPRREHGSHKGSRSSRRRTLIKRLSRSPDCGDALVFHAIAAPGQRQGYQALFPGCVGPGPNDLIDLG